MLNPPSSSNSPSGVVASLLAVAASNAARAEPALSDPPAVGVVEAVRVLPRRSHAAVP
jgi:hypothetical protein